MEKLFVCSDTFWHTLMFDYTNLSAAFLQFCIIVTCFTKKVIFLQFSDMQMSMHGAIDAFTYGKSKLVFTDFWACPRGNGLKGFQKKFAITCLKAFERSPAVSMAKTLKLSVSKQHLTTLETPPRSGCTYIWKRRYNKTIGEKSSMTYPSLSQSWTEVTAETRPSETVLNY